MNTDKNGPDDKIVGSSDVLGGFDPLLQYREQGASARRSGALVDENPYTVHLTRGRGRGRLSAIRYKVMANRYAAWNDGWINAAPNAALSGWPEKDETEMRKIKAVDECKDGGRY